LLPRLSGVFAEEVGIEEVEELSITSSISGSGRASVDHGGELEVSAPQTAQQAGRQSAPQEGQQKQQNCKLLLKSNSKSRRNLAL
jgi:hypothetical protein